MTFSIGQKVRSNQTHFDYVVVGHDEGNYSAISYTRLSKEYLDERFDTWDDAVSRAHDLVSTVAVGGIDSKTWPEAKVRAESQYDPVLF